MRKLKFRAWDKNMNSFIENENLFINEGKVSHIRYGLTVCEVLNDEDYIISQWTGLLDKNKTEIYEDDILKPGGQVAWDNYNSKFYCIFNDGLDRDFNGFTELVVIGNIYENEELLND